MTGANAAWVHVGEGRGGYEVVKTYSYVGEGRGNYDKEDGQMSEAPRKWGAGLFGIVSCTLACAGVVCFAVACFAGGQRAALAAKDWSTMLPGRLPWGGSAAASARSAAATYDCTAGFEHYKTAWPETQQRWCCSQWGRGCNGTAAPCEADKEHTWDATKKAWCCTNYGRGCPSHSAAQLEVVDRGVCAVACSVAGESARCGERIRWAALHRFSGHPDACQRSHGVVAHQCPACTACDIGAAACAGPPVAAGAVAV